MSEYIRKNRPQKRTVKVLDNEIKKNRASAIESKKQRMLAKRAARRRRLKMIFNLFLIIILLSIIVFVAVYSPLFNIREVVVSGNQRVPTSAILKHAKIPKGKSTFRYAEGNLVDKILQTWSKTEERLIDELPELKSVEVSFTLNGTINVLVNEREPLGWIESKNKYFLVDKEGIVITESKKKKEGFRLLGLEGKSIKVGNKIKVRDKELNSLVRLVEVFETQKGMPKDVVKNIVSFDISKEDMLSFGLNTGITVNLGDISYLSNPDLIYRFQFVKSALKELKGRKSGVIDCTGETVVYRPK